MKQKVSKLIDDVKNNENLEVLADTLQSALKTEVTALEESQQSEFFDWLCGKTENMPRFVECLIGNLAYKINTSMGFLCAMSIQRLYRLTQFMNEEEGELFSSEKVHILNDKELMDLYKTANVTIMQTMEFVRKYLVQNQDSINFDTNDESTKIAKILSTFPPEKLAQLKALFMSVS